MAANLTASKICKQCGSWIEGHIATLCVDCRRKANATKFETCNFPSCQDTYKVSGKNRYCVVHKGMTTSERKAAIAKMEAANGAQS